MQWRYATSHQAKRSQWLCIGRNRSKNPCKFSPSKCISKYLHSSWLTFGFVLLFVFWFALIAVWTVINEARENSHPHHVHKGSHFGRLGSECGSTRMPADSNWNRKIAFNQNYYFSPFSAICGDAYVCTDLTADMSIIGWVGFSSTFSACVNIVAFI